MDKLVHRMDRQHGELNDTEYDPSDTRHQHRLGAIPRTLLHYLESGPTPQ